MSNWQQDWMERVETTAQDIERYFQEVTREIGEVATVLLEISDEAAHEMQEAIAPSLDKLGEQFEQYFTDWIEPFLDALADQDALTLRDDHSLEDSFFGDDSFQSFGSLPEPMIRQHPICRGCRHYHGMIYGGTPLICAMHPYGIVDGAESCPDKELRVPQLPPDEGDRLP
ncbi:MAG: hypothetical protein MUF49_06910 [Oculatellaceae cyanobacterium Prado106]|jgi:hypothetical protein|nr:hypothetical protein [Oculatellaceae cyanobacterium Prado106]